MLVSRVKPCPIANDRSTEACREIVESHAFVAALTGLWCRQWEADGLTRESGRLPIVGSVVKKPITPLPGNDIHHTALNVAIFDGSPHGLNLYFLYEVNARFGSRDTITRACIVRAIDQPLVFVSTRAGDG